MGTGFSSIEDLLGASKKTGSSGKAPAYGSPEDLFHKKMKQVSQKEKEVEVQRSAALVSVPYISLEHFPVSHEALRQIPEQEARDKQVVCFFATPEEFRLGAVSPTDGQADELLHVLEEKNNSHGKIYSISEASLQHVLLLYKTLPVVHAISKDVSIQASELEQVQASVNDFLQFQEQLRKSTTTDLLTFIMGAALKLEASDVHIEAEEQRIVLRFRIDGILHDAASITSEQYKKLVSRLKLLSSLKINITDKPQDGRFTVKTSTGDIDIRVSLIPTIYGESIVMRLLVQRQEAYSFEELGLRGQQLDRLKREMDRPNGMIITTGPTGSGKTTTLYAMMHQLNKPDVKIITLEDPVEYKMPGINQSQIDRSSDYTFAKGLRSLLRQDPDIAMVGEIRDLETADIAIQAALTGHLMLSTVHTNDAFGAIARFLSMGVQPFLLAPALNCVIGQRLVRRLRDDLKQPTTLTASQQERVTALIEDLPEPLRAEVKNRPQVFYSVPEENPQGELGYQGRLGIYEVFVVDDDIEAAISAGNVGEVDIRRLAKKQGTITMAQDGILKALDGLTSVEEVFRVIE